MEFLMVIIMVIIFFAKMAIKEEEAREEEIAEVSPLLKTDGERATAREMMKSDTADSRGVEAEKSDWMRPVERRTDEKEATSVSMDWQSLAKKGRGVLSDIADAFSEEESGSDEMPALKALSAAEIRRRYPAGGEEKKRSRAVEIKERHEAHLGAEWEANEEKNRREREASAKRFASARTKQADAEQLHTVHIDSCEGRLESLKVLYEAGILDREEYRARVKRTKQRHRASKNA